MKILVIVSNVGKTAPGIVFERLIEGLTEGHEIDVVAAKLDSVAGSAARVTEISERTIHPRVSKWLIGVLGISPLDWLWSRRVAGTLKGRKFGGYDLVFSFISFHHYAPLLAGAYCAKVYGAKLAVYSVDAIPAPVGWSKEDAYFRSVKALVRRLLPKADFFFSANRQMLEYQLNLFKPKESVITGVVYNPNSGKIRYFDSKSRIENVFLYTGGIYGVRTPKYVLGAFLELLKVHPESTLEFVGSRIPEHYFGEYGEEERKKVIIHPFTNDLTPFYERATALIDIDADIEDDVFLSSKIVNYIAINRLIISETGRNSPSREIFRGIGSILQCDHNSKELFEAMLHAVEIRSRIDFSDRDEVLKVFSIKKIVEGLTSKIGADGSGLA